MKIYKRNLESIGVGYEAGLDIEVLPGGAGRERPCGELGRKRDFL